MMKNVVSIIIFVVLFAGMWNLLDFLYSTFITHSGYTFSFSTDMIMPLAVLLVNQIVTMNRKNKE